MADSLLAHLSVGIGIERVSACHFEFGEGGAGVVQGRIETDEGIRSSAASRSVSVFQ